MIGEINPLVGFVAENIDQYCMQNSTLPSEACENIERYTAEHVPMAYMVSGAQVGSLLHFMTQTLCARRALEVGCYTGYSALAIAEALPESGELVTLDINPETAQIARQMWDRSPHGKKIRNILGPALETLKSLTGLFDLVFIDADKGNYRNYLDLALERLSPKGVILADNCLYQGKVLDVHPTEANARELREFNAYVHGRSDLVSTLLPVRDGIHMITRKTN
jgi:caffeoyl-CoA O-methyltransferase